MHVVRVIPSHSAPVFNLTVDGRPEYFANGILVHNCDAMRYMAKWVAKYTQKPLRPGRKRQAPDPFSRLPGHTFRD